MSIDEEVATPGGPDEKVHSRSNVEIPTERTAMKVYVQSVRTKAKRRIRPKVKPAHRVKGPHRVDYWTKASLTCLCGWTGSTLEEFAIHTGRKTVLSVNFDLMRCKV